MIPEMQRKLFFMTNICIYAITLKIILTANPKADALCLMKDTAMGKAKEQRRRRE